MAVSHSIGTAPWRIALAALACIGLAACEDGFQLGGATAAAGDGATTVTPTFAGRVVEQEVEAPEVFQVTDDGLWDGRPSLGGVWVAHPDVGEPERVIVRNSDNGREVTAALFRREREQPGPALQVSSEAATALGMIAGDPARLSVTALRTREVTIEAPAPAETAPAETAPTEALEEAGEIAATELAPAATAAAATVAAARPEARPETVEPPAPEEGETVVVDLPPAEPQMSAGDIAAAAAAAIETAPEAEAPAAPEGLDKPFIQVGIFTVEDNANAAADTLRGAGIVPTILFQDGDSPFWRVVVGPVTSSGDRAALLDRITSLGFADAFTVTN